MTADDFRKLAMGLPETTEGEHMGHPDFRVRGKIFATLWYPDESFGMVKLAPKEQAEFVEASPDAFSPVPGGWGKRGCTRVRLKSAKKLEARNAMLLAWRGAAPKDLAR
jgi:hypothetical protein